MDREALRGMHLGGERVLTLLVGGFFGDEGKGKIAAYVALAKGYRYAARTGAINAGHTVVYHGRKFKLRSVPAGFVNKETQLVIPPGALIKLDVFFSEVRELGVEKRICVDYRTGVIEEVHVDREKRDSVLASIGSTFQGVGAAMADRVLRRLRLARDFNELEKHLCDAPLVLNTALDTKEKVLVEGTQGTFLSLYHGTYPYVTSRDTTAQALLSEVGIGPKRVDEVIVVFKVYVTRVGEGPLEGELGLEDVARRGWLEVGTVTGRPRRVAPFNYELAKRAVLLNSATQVAITKLDVLFPEARGVKVWDRLPAPAKKWIEDVESYLKVPVTLIGTGEEVEETVDRTRDLGVEL
ncbi:MAG: adenylosuccinate synthetase [Desulfurococcaceae archaeon]